MSKTTKVRVECSNPKCPRRGAGPNGRKILGSVWTPFNKVSFNCPYCDSRTYIHGELSPAPGAPLAERIENPALRRILYPDEKK